MPFANSSLKASPHLCENAFFLGAVQHKRQLGGLAHRENARLDVEHDLVVGRRREHRARLELGGGGARQTCGRAEWRVESR